MVAAEAPRLGRPGQVLARVGAALLLLVQLGWGLWGIDNLWQWGHNGYNTAAYQVAARNTLRWGELFPVQYLVGEQAPTSADLYTHAPLGLHLHTTASVALLGDSYWAVRLVPALLGVLALAALLAVVWRRWSPAHGLLAGFIYVLLPINHAFANMANHSTGLILGALLALEGYLRFLEAPAGAARRGPAALLLGGAAYAMLWDWPACYIMLCIALHGLYASFDPQVASRPLRWGFNTLHLALAGFCAFVLLHAAATFGLIFNAAGSFAELQRAFSSRHEAPPGVWGTIATFALVPMFSPALLGCAGLWGVGTLLRHAQRRLQARDLIPLAFLAAGVLHTVIFRATAVIHIYWMWPLNPFFAIAAATTLLGIASWLRAALPPLRPLPARLLGWGVTALILALPLAAYLRHTLPLVPEGRRVAGTFRHAGYQSDLLRVAFAEQVHRWTTPRTGVLIHRAFSHRIEVLATLDRTPAPTLRPDHPAPPPHLHPADGWVVIGPVQQTPRAQLVAAAARHPYRQYGLYYMIDTRREGVDIQIWNLYPVPEPPLAWRLFVNPFEGPWEERPDPQAEARLRREVEALGSRGR